MKHHVTKKVEVTHNILESMQCDICATMFKADNNISDEMEIQEFHHIKFTAGYGSVFGDGNVVECDICQSCLKNKLGDYFRITRMPY